MQNEYQDKQSTTQRGNQQRLPDRRTTGALSQSQGNAHTWVQNLLEQYHINLFTGTSTLILFRGKDQCQRSQHIGKDS